MRVSWAQNRGNTADHQTQADFWDAKAAAADVQARNVREILAIDSWLMIANTCRELAAQFREMDKESNGPPVARNH